MNRNRNQNRNGTEGANRDEGGVVPCVTYGGEARDRWAGGSVVDNGVRIGGGEGEGGLNHQQHSIQEPHYFERGGGGGG